MNSVLLVGILMGIIIGVTLSPQIVDALYSIPPTIAIKTIFVGSDPNDNVTADSYAGNTTFIEGSGITITPDFLNNELTFTATGGAAGTWESLTNVTDTFCTTNQVRKAVGNQWVCADDNIGSAGTLESLTNVTDVGCATGQIRKVSGANWVCAADDTGAGATTLDGLTDVTITGVAYNHILQYNLALTQWVNKLFSIDTQTAQTDFQIIGINNQTGAITRNQFSVNTEDAGYFSRIKSINNVTGHVAYDTIDFIDTTDCGYGSRVKSVDNVTGVVTCDTIDFVDTTTCSGTDKVSAINNITGVVTCTADSGGGGGGIPLPPKKWGELMPVTASTDTLGLVSGCSILATATFVYDATAATSGIRSTTEITDGINGGIHCTGTNRHLFRGDQNAYMYSKFQENKITTNRVFIGFSSSATHLPNNADTILNNLSGVGLCIRTSDTVYQMCRNDGDATTDYATLTTSEDTGIHYVEVYTTDAGVTWCVKLDGGTAVCHTTEIPAITTRMYAMSTGETDGGATAIIWTQYHWYLQNDR